MPHREGAPSGPQRRCAACRARRPKAELLRFVRGPGGVEPDPEQVGPGRGGYCCPDPACVERGLRRGGLARTLRTPLSQEDAGRLAAWALEYLRGVHRGTAARPRIP